MLIAMRSSSGNGRMAVALPSSVCRRQTNPGLVSASALRGSSCVRKPSMIGSSIGARKRPMFTCARWNRVTRMPSMQSRGSHGADAMRLAVADVEHAAGVDEDAVRPRQRALERVALRTVAAPAGAEHRPDDARLQVDFAHDVILRIRHVQAIA